MDKKGWGWPRLTATQLFACACDVDAGVGLDWNDDNEQAYKPLGHERCAQLSPASRPLYPLFPLVVMSFRANKRYGPKPHNYTMMQAFEWYVEGDGKHWKHLKSEIPKLEAMGITALWLPPPCKASSKNSVGYDIYDVWDLGEFDQKSQIGTKYGTKNELLDLIKYAGRHGVVCYLDAVLNHKFGADKTEVFRAVEVARDDRMKELSEPHDITAWTGFEFPGRQDKYSSFKWNFNHFTGVDWNEDAKKDGIFRILGDNKGWAMAVDIENRNYDYLMGADIDHAHGDVEKDLLDWGAWVVQETGNVGFRFDAIKHIDETFIAKFVAHVREQAGKEDLFCVGEFWKDSLDSLSAYLGKFGQQFSVFDTPLHYNFKEASERGESYDLRSIWDGTLVKNRPIDAVTLVDNHDTQVGQALESCVAMWFKPLAYALILLRVDGYPCVFYGDLYGCGAGDNDNPPAQQPVAQLADIIKARREFAYGEIRDYWDHPNCVGWVRTGDKDHPNGCAVVLCNGTEEGSKWMEVGKAHAGEQWTDLLGWYQEDVTLNDDGWGEFKCHAKSIGIWVKRSAVRHQHGH